MKILKFKKYLKKDKKKSLSKVALSKLTKKFISKIDKTYKKLSTKRKLKNLRT